MTDLEITRLCAEAMRLCPIQKGKQIYSGIAFDNEGDLLRYDPLRDDAQAMALTKKFDLATWKEEGKWVATWGEQHENGASVAGAENSNLNRAICECVARMQAGEPSGERR